MNGKQERFGASRDDIAAWMIAHIRSVLDVRSESFPVTDRFDTYGLDSVEAVIMAGLMEEEYGVQIDPIEMFNHPSVAAFSEFLARYLATSEVS